MKNEAVKCHICNKESMKIIRLTMFVAGAEFESKPICFDCIEIVNNGEKKK